MKYHADFEKAKGKLTQVTIIKGKPQQFFIKKVLCFQVADDPETLRIKQNTKNFSNVAYHGDIQKKAAMERQRELTEIVDNRGRKKIQFKAGFSQSDRKVLFS